MRNLKFLKPLLSFVGGITFTVSYFVARSYLGQGFGEINLNRARKQIISLQWQQNHIFLFSKIFIFKVFYPSNYKT